MYFDAYLETQEEKLLRNIAREFAINELRPRAHEVDQSKEQACKFMKDMLKRAGDLDFFNLWVEPEFGGMKAPLTNGVVIIEEIAKECAHMAVGTWLQMICVAALQSLPAKEREKFLPPAQRGERIVAVAQTEPVGNYNIWDWKQDFIVEDGDY